MKVKRKIAALLTLALVATGQPANIFAGGMRAILTGYAAERETAASPSDAEENTVSEEEKEKYRVTVNVEPEEGASVRAPKKAETGDRLEFDVKVKKGYTLNSVQVSGTELEGEYNEDDGRYYYEYPDVSEAPEINVYLEETECPSYEESFDVDGVIFEVSAEEGALPEGTTAEIKPLKEETSEDDEAEFESVKKAVLEKAKLEDEETPVYGAYRIVLKNAAGNVLDDKEIEGDVKVSVSGMKNLAENSELFEVGEANPLPTKAYRIEKRNSASRLLLGEMKVSKTETEEAEEENPETEAVFRLKGADEMIGLVMTAPPKMMNIDALFGINSDEMMVEVSIEGGPADVKTHELPVGNIANNAAGLFDGYNYINATVGDTVITDIAEYPYGGEIYIFYRAEDGHVGGIKESGSDEIVLHYEKVTETFEINADDNGNGKVIVTNEHGDAVNEAEAGEEITLRIEPDAGYKLVGLIKDNENIYELGKNVYNFIMPEESVNIFATFAEAETFTVKFTPVGKTGDYIESNPEVEDPIAKNGTVNRTITIKDYGDNLNPRNDFVYIMLNDELITLNDKGETNDKNVDGITISVKRGGYQADYTRDFKVTITGINRDLEIKYFIRKTAVLDKNHDASITILQSDNTDIYVLGPAKEDELDDETLKKAALGDVFYMDDNLKVYFYLKNQPGYEPKDANVSGEIGIERIGSDWPGATEATEKGCFYGFVYTGVSEDDWNRTISLTATPIEYSIKYDGQGANRDTVPIDGATYNIETNSEIAISSQRPSKDNSIFKGWQLGEDGPVYQPEGIITIDEDIVEYANENNELVLNAVWSDKEEDNTVKFTVEYYYQQQLDNGDYEYPQTTEDKKTFSGVAGEYVFAETSYKEGYVFDENAEGNVLNGTLQKGEHLTLKVYYALDRDNDEIPDDCEVRVTFAAVNGKFAGGDGEEGYRTIVKTYGLAKAEDEYDPSAEGYFLTDIPEAGNPDDGYTIGVWDPYNGYQPVAEGSYFPKEATTFTYRFKDINEDKTKYTIIYNAGEGVAPADVTGMPNPNIYTGIPEGAERTLTDAVPEREGYVFDGWKTEPESLTITGGTFTMPASDVTFTATWAEDENGDGVADKEQFEVIFDLGTEYGAAFNMSESAEVTISEDKTKAVYWYDEGDTLKASPEDYAMPEDERRTVESWEDENGMDYDKLVGAGMVKVGEGWLGTERVFKAKYGMPKLTVVFNAGAHGSLTGEAKHTLDNGGRYPEAPDVTAEDGYVFTGWYDGEGKAYPAGTEWVYIPEIYPADGTLTFTARYEADENGDNVPDKDQKEATLQVYTTTVYSGGREEDGVTDDPTGFPKFELEYVNGNRPVNDEAITSITINGYPFTEEKTDDLFTAVYYDEAEGEVIENDSEGGEYKAYAVLKAAAARAFDEGTVYDDNGLLRKREDGKLIKAGEYGLGITAGYEDEETPATRALNDTTEGEEVSYNVTTEAGELTVRDVNNENSEIYRDVRSSVEELDPTRTRAGAVIDPKSEFYTNGDEGRPVDRDGILILADDVAADRQVLILEKAFETAYGLSLAEAEARGYKYILRYFDLVDSKNGNAWVESSLGTDVYIPYQEGTDTNTEFTLLHFVGLHRENGEGYGGDADDVMTAIEECVPVNMAEDPKAEFENTEYGVKFHTEGKDAFSPFVLIWKTDDGSSDDGNGSGSGNSGGGSATPGAGPGASGSSYTSGVHGNWVHTDPADINSPISEPVPEGATPVTSPEWYRWRFILNNGTMLYDQWAYVKNPYATDGQPKEGKFRFDENGVILYGWYRDEDTGKWYYLHRESDGILGMTETGWHYDMQDKKWYYLDPDGGEMVLGWRQIDGKWYYFNPYAPEVTWDYDERAGVWMYNGSVSRPYGSMYVNESTPDGYAVDENGAWRE